MSSEIAYSPYCKHIRDWVEDNNMLPPSQNGFRQGYKTNKNAFILCCAIDKAHALGITLYVAFVDCSNAFPWTDHATLWLKLYCNGAGGPFFDWIHILYHHIRYCVRLDKDISEEFKSLIGILTGDSASPDLWTVFLADFRPPSDEADIILGGTAIGNLEQADDMVLFSSTAIGLQKKLNYMWHYGSVNFLLVNIIKTLAMIFGPIPKNVCSFHFDGIPIKFTDEYTYVGITFVSNFRNIFAKQYQNKALKARTIANAIFSIESFIGSLPPLQGKRLYNGRVDPHLVAACEISLDVDPLLLAPMQKVQHTFLRRLLGLNPRSMCAVLYTETGVLPLAYRRIILALKYLLYILSLPQSHLTNCAFRECELLHAAAKPSWLGDLVVVLDRLPYVPPVYDPLLLTEASVTKIMTDVNLSMCLHLDTAINSLSKGQLLYG